MTNSKRIIAIIIAVITLMAPIFMVISNSPSLFAPSETEPPASDPTTAPIPTGPVALPTEPTTESPSDIPTGPSNTEPAPTETTPTSPSGEEALSSFDFVETVQLSDTVTIRKVATDPNEVIDRDMTVSESHPEYIPYGDAKGIFSVEGKVFRNDRVISIEVQDRFIDTTYTISFGFPTGQCNRFLYLNPHCELNPVVDGFFESDVHFNFLKGSDGEISNFGSSAPAYPANYPVVYYMNRHLDEGKVSANYLNPQYPGAVWYTYGPMDEQGQILCRVFSSRGYHVATLALIVEKDEQGCYAFTDIKNLDLWTDNSEYPMFTSKELERVTDLLEQEFTDGNIPHLEYMYKGIDLSPDNCTFVIRTSETGYFYSRFVNINPNGSDNCKDVARDMPYTLAVTMNAHTYGFCGTVYLHITKMPSEGEEGWYQIVGCDYKKFDNAEDVADPRPDF